MFWVMEYGAEIGTLKNIFREKGHAVYFVQKVIRDSGSAYVQIKPYHWYCKEKNEYIEILPA